MTPVALAAPKSPYSKERYLLLLRLDTLGLFHRVRPRMKRALDGLLPMLFLPRMRSEV